MARGRPRVPAFPWRSVRGRAFDVRAARHLQASKQPVSRVRGVEHRDPRPYPGVRAVRPSSLG